MSDADRLKGLSTDTAGTMERPRDAQNKEYQRVSPVSRIEVHRQELIELEGIDPDSLDPEKHYRLVNARDPRVHRRRIRQGYSPEKLGAKGGVKTIIEPESSEDGTLRFGDRILMSCPMSEYRARREKNFRLTETRLGAATAAPGGGGAAPDLVSKAASYGTHVVDGTQGHRTTQQTQFVEEKQK